MRARAASRSSVAMGTILFVTSAACALGAACGSSGEGDSGGATGGASSKSTGSKGSSNGGTSSGGNSGTSNGGLSTTGTMGSANGGSGGTMKVTSNYPCPGCMPFPSDNSPTCSASKLGDASIAYPPNQVLLPPNMNVLEVQFVPPANATLFEVDFENSVTDVKVETKCDPVPDVRQGPSKGCGVTLSQQAWNDIANVNRDGDPLKVIVRSTADGSCVTSSKTQIEISFAKEDIAGGIYYWQSAQFMGFAGTTGGIYSHDFGSFDPTPTPFYTADASGTCVGCHNVSRDGQRMSLAIDDPDADDEFSDVHTLVIDVTTKTGLGTQKGPGMGMGALSPGFQTWTSDHSLCIASTFKDQMDKGWDIIDGNTGNLVSTLKTTSQVTMPDLSVDDKSLVFVQPAVIANEGDHHILGGSIYWSTFDASTPSVGASQALLNASGSTSYYYPTVSPSLNFIALNEIDDNSAANNNGDSFYSRQARVKLAHFPAGGSTIDLPNLNDTGNLSNSWPRWSPFVTTYKGHKIVWVTFSSNRDYGLHLSNDGFDDCYPPESPNYDQPQGTNKMGVDFTACAEPQIWMAAVVVDDDPKLDAMDRSYKAFWLPFQDVNAHNHSAQWVAAFGNNPDGGAGSSSTMSSGTGGSGTGGADGGSCGGEGAPCTQGCCADKFCCGGICTDPSNCVK